MKDELTNAQYKFICELLWGCVPIEKEWAIETPIFKINAPKILEKYPKLDKSFHDQSTR